MENTSSSIHQWKYTAYEKIPENPNQWNLTESDYRNFKKTDWVVTEKIHGANFGIVTDGKTVRFAKRKEFLDSEEDFFGYQILKEELVCKAKEIFNILQLQNINLGKVFIYGETTRRCQFLSRRSGEPGGGIIWGRISSPGSKFSFWSSSNTNWGILFSEYRILCF